MEETRIRSPNIGAVHNLTSNLTLDALGPGNAAEGTYPSNDASCESLGVVMPSNTDFLLPSDNNDASYESLGITMPSNTDIFLPSDNTAAFWMEFIEDPQALLEAINDTVVVAGYESDGNVEEILHAAAEKEGPQDFDEDEVITAGALGQNIPQAKIVAAPVDVPLPMSEEALKNLKKDQICHQLTICGVTFDKAKTKAELSKILGKSLHLPVDGVKVGTKKAIQISGFPVSAYLRLSAQGTVKATVLSLAWMKPEEYWKM